MKVAIPVIDKSMQSKMCPNFGRTPYFLIYDTESQEGTFLDNSAVASQGGSGIKAAQTIVDQKVDALITPRLGENAAEVMQMAKIAIYQAKTDHLQDSIDALATGKLSLLDEIHPGFHHSPGR